MKPTLLILAAGMGSRYGGLKQVDPVGPKNEALIEFSIYDAIRAGFGKVVFVIRPDIEEIFKEKFSNKFDDKIEVSYAFQEVNTPIEGIDKLPERVKPWGTAHAMLVARNQINEPFAVINADDYYGIHGFEIMADFLRTKCSPDLYSMVGYELSNTLSDHGTVNRGVCEMDEHNYLTNVVERHKVKKEGAVATYDDGQNGRGELPIDTLVSMNFWGFHPNIFEIIRKDFITFVQENKSNPKAEFYIPLVANRLIEEDEVKIEVLPNNEQWYGVTYQDDKPMVVAAFQKLVEQGSYPQGGLW